MEALLVLTIVYLYFPVILLFKYWFQYREDFTGMVISFIIFLSYPRILSMSELDFGDILTAPIWCLAIPECASNDEGRWVI